MKLEQKNKSSHSVAEALSWDAEEKEYNLYSINKYNLLYIRPGLTEEHALVYLTDGTVLKTYNPYPYIKGRFNEFPLYYNWINPPSEASKAFLKCSKESWWYLPFSNWSEKGSDIKIWNDSPGPRSAVTVNLINGDRQHSPGMPEVYQYVTQLIEQWI